MKFKVGDRVKVKSLEEIKRLSETESGASYIWSSCEDDDGLGRVIKTGGYFVPEMYDLCEKEFTIEKVDEDGHYELSGEDAWYFIASWLELFQHYVETFDEE